MGGIGCNGVEIPGEYSIGKKGGTGTGFVPIIYRAENVDVQKKVGDFLEKKFNYGFNPNEGDFTIYFFDGENVFATMYEDGKIELSPFANPLIVSEVEKIVGGKN